MKRSSPERSSAKPKKRGSILAVILFLLLTAILLYSSYKLFGIWKDDRRAASVQEGLLQYKPEPTAELTLDDSFERAADADETTVEESEVVPQEKQENASLLKLQEIYPDVRGWITIDGTNIDYCFAQGRDNSEYLRNTLDGDYLASGTVFLDSCCSGDLTDFNSIVYGHNMKNSTMFGDLPEFADNDFFREHTTGTLYLPYETCGLKIFAYLVVSSADTTIYNMDISQEEFLSYVRENAVQYREPNLNAGDSLLTLSTCNYEYDGARSVIIAQIVR